MNDKIYRITEWISKLALLNLLWLLTSALGLVLFTFFPATVAMFATVRDFLTKDISTPVTKTFVYHFKKDFLRSTGYGLIVLLIGLIGYADLLFINQSQVVETMLFHIPLYLFLIFAFLTLLYLIPIYVHYDFPFFTVIKRAFLTMLIHPIQTLLMLTTVALSVYLMTFIPGLLFFYGGSFISLVLMSISLTIFQQLSERQTEKNAIQTAEPSH